MFVILATFIVLIASTETEVGTSETNIDRGISKKDYFELNCKVLDSILKFSTHEQLPTRDTTENIANLYREFAKKQIEVFYELVEYYKCRRKKRGHLDIWYSKLREHYKLLQIKSSESQEAFKKIEEGSIHEKKYLERSTPAAIRKCFNKKVKNVSNMTSLEWDQTLSSIVRLIRKLYALCCPLIKNALEYGNINIPESIHRKRNMVILFIIGANESDYEAE